MDYGDHLADRVKKILWEKRVLFEEKKMMGGLRFMVKEKMCIGVEKIMLMARVDPDMYEKALRRKRCHEMDFTGKPIKGYVFIDPIGKDLEYWIQRCLDFNPKVFRKPVTRSKIRIAH